MAAWSIKKHELQSFLEKEVAPRFGSKWIVRPHCELQRRSGYFIQGLSLFRLSFGPLFRVDLFNSMLIPEIDMITLFPLRERKTRLSTGSWFSRFLMPKEVWIEWDKRFDELDRIVTLIHSQLEPPYDQEITLESVLRLISREPHKDDNFPQIWARAVIRGLLGDMQFARQTMEQLIDTFSAAAEKYKAMGDESYQSRISVEVQRKNSAREMLEAMNDDKSFRDYCDALTDKAVVKAGFLPK
ncbi:MAG: hypothetical protein GKR94_32745 [Gammaproteobacteria bacterium]|nr:hypothetical protein [Gammaproteobacteria bacterium]